MNRKKKIILYISIILIIAILSFGIYLFLSIHEKYTGVITSIEDNIVTVEELENKITAEEMQWTDIQYYRFSVENVVIQNFKGQNIDVSKLKEGDTICIIRIKDYKRPDLIFYTQLLDKIRLIKVLNKY